MNTNVLPCRALKIFLQFFERYLRITFCDFKKSDYECMCNMWTCHSVALAKDGGGAGIRTQEGIIPRHFQCRALSRSATPPI